MRIGSGSLDQVTPSPWFISPRHDGWWWYDPAAINESDNVPPMFEGGGARRLFALRLPLLSQTRRRVAACREAADWCSRGLRWSNIAREQRGATAPSPHTRRAQPGGHSVLACSIGYWTVELRRSVSNNQQSMVADDLGVSETWSTDFIYIIFAMNVYNM